MARGRTPARLDWEKASESLDRERPKRFRAFGRRPLGFFRLSQRRSWLAYMIGENSLPKRLDPDTVLPYVANQALLLVKELGRAVVLFGIHKKGASLLNDLAETHSAIGERTIVYDNQETESDVRGRKVLIIDDSIHDGETCREIIQRLRREGAREVSVFVVVGSEEGLGVVAKERVRIKCLWAVPDALFTVAFGILMVPTLGLFRNGALSNRPYRTFSINTPDVDPQTGALKCLRLLAGVSCFGFLSEVPVADGGGTSVFHGTAKPSALLQRQLRTRFAGRGVIDQAKFRIFLSQIDGAFHLCVCAIVWPIGSADRTLDEIKEASDQAAAWLLDGVEASMKKSFSGTGYHIARTKPLLED